MTADAGLEPPVFVAMMLLGRSFGSVGCRRNEAGLVDETDAVRRPGDEIRCVSVGCLGRSSSRDAR